jgi:hypothetical protein
LLINAAKNSDQTSFGGGNSNFLMPGAAKKQRETASDNSQDNTVNSKLPDCRIGAGAMLLSKPAPERPSLKDRPIEDIDIIPTIIEIGI